MDSWKILELGTEPHKPEILSSSDDARVIVIDLPEGQALEEHEVHERAWLIPVAGTIEVESTMGGESVSGGAGLLVEFAPSERHRVVARSDARLLLFLTPWPGDGHPGALSAEEKANARERAAEIKAQAEPG